MSYKNFLNWAVAFLFTTCILISFQTCNSPRILLGTDFLAYLIGADILYNKGDLYDLKTQITYKNKWFTNIYLQNQNNRVITTLMDTYKEYIYNHYMLPYKNLPVTALLFIPFIKINYILAFNIFLTLQIISLILSGWLINEKLWSENPLYFATFCILTSPMSLLTGQISIYLLLIIIFYHKFITTRQYFLAGVFSSLLMLKPTLLVIVPFLLLIPSEKHNIIKGFLGFISSFIVLIMVNLLLYGKTTILVDYKELITTVENAQFGSFHQAMHSFYYFMQNFSTNIKAILISNFLLYSVMLIVFIMVKKKMSYNSQLLYVLTFAPFFAIHVLTHDLIFILLPLYFLVQQRLQLLQDTQKIKRSTNMEASKIIKKELVLLVLIYLGLIAIKWVSFIGLLQQIAIVCLVAIYLIYEKCHYRVY